eukprot:scaffold52028_cov74-Phaeocystis_antarctica.AAC.4
MLLKLNALQQQRAQIRLGAAGNRHNARIVLGAARVRLGGARIRLGAAHIRLGAARIVSPGRLRDPLTNAN